MKTFADSKLRRVVLGTTALAGLLFLSGCLDERIVWSPDGNRAAVIAKDGLRLCDGEGRLTSLLLPDVSVVAWLSDSQGLVVGRSREVRDWATIARVLGPERSAAVEGDAESLWRHFQNGGVWSVVLKDPKGDKTTAKICLRDRHAADLRAKLSAAEWKELESLTARINDLMRAQLEGDKIVAGAVLHSGLGTVWSIRPAPGAKVIAFTEEMKPESDELELFVAPLEGPGDATVVAKYVSAYPDWTPDGRSVVYFGSAGPGSTDDEIRLGALTRREVLDADRQIMVNPKPDFLAGVLFNVFGRVRCLRDGRILFNAAEVNLPFATEDYDNPREQLFALEPSRQPTLIRLVPHKREADLPSQLSFFEVSPEGRQVLFGSTKGEVGLLTLATGEVEQIQTPLNDSPQGAPVWRKSGEFTYVKRVGTKMTAGSRRSGEVILRQGKQEVVLSRTWPDDVLKGVNE